MKNEAKAATNILFKNFNTFMRHMFSGLVAVFLFEIGNSGVSTFVEIEVVSEMQLSQGMCYALAALVVGNLTYLLLRYMFCALFMWRRHKKNPDKYGRGLSKNRPDDYLVEIGRFAQYRWSEEFSPKLNEYLISAWGWIHGLGSVAIVLIVIPGYFIILDRSPFDGRLGWICIIGGILLFVSYCHHICLLLSMEHIAYEERNDKKEDTSELLQIKRDMSQMKRGLW